jgi:hypothetical protein
MPAELSESACRVMEVRHAHRKPHKLATGIAISHNRYVRFTGPAVVMVGFFAILIGVTFQRFRQALQDHGELRKRLERNGRRVRREILWAAGAALVVYIAYEVIEHGGLK